MKWKDKLLKKLFEELIGEPKWKNVIQRALINKGVTIHLAVFTEPFLSLMLRGEKKIESRFSINKIDPYGKIKNGDIVLVKKSGGPIVAIFFAGRVQFVSGFNKSQFRKIQNKYGPLICSKPDSSFWRDRANARYGTLIEIDEFKPVSPISSGKVDRRPWVVLRLGDTHTLFEGANDPE